MDEQFEIIMNNGAILLNGLEHDDVIDYKNHTYLINSEQTKRALVYRSLGAGIIIGKQAKKHANLIPVIRVNDGPWPIR